MTNLIVEVSKYLMILLMAIYTYANFRFFSFPDLERKRKVCARQNRAMFLLHFLAYVVMYLKTEELHGMGAENMWKCKEAFLSLCFTLLYDLSPLILFKSICIDINAFSASQERAGSN